MANSHLIAGIASILFGALITLKQIKVFRQGEQDRLGFDIRLLIGGICFVFIGLALLSDL